MNVRLLVIDGSSNLREVALEGFPCIIGRKSDCQLRILSPMISRHHCELVECEGKLVVRDLGSANGTLLNGKRVDGEAGLTHGDVVQVGPVRFRVQISADTFSIRDVRENLGDTSLDSGRTDTPEARKNPCADLVRN